MSLKVAFHNTDHLFLLCITSFWIEDISQERLIVHDV